MLFGCSLAFHSVVHAAPPARFVLTETVVTEPVFHGKVHVFTAGSPTAPTVVLVHGLGDNGARDWDGLIPVLARDYRVIAFDLPGFGRSSKGNEFYSPDRYADFLRFLVAGHFNTKKISLVGHSMGGAIALRYAARYPQDVTSLVIVDVPGILHPIAYSKFLSHIGIDYLPSLYPAQNDHLSRMMNKILGLSNRVQPVPAVIVATPKLRQNFLKADPGKIAGLALAIENFSADFPRIQAPVLVLWGGRDSVAPIRNGRVLSAVLPQAQLEVFAGSGHTPMDDVPDAFNARVEAFLSAPRLERKNDIMERKMVKPISGRNGTCEGRQGITFEGDYDRITIHRCRDILIRKVRVRDLRISDATVTIEDSLIGGSDGQMRVDDGRVNITSSAIEGKVAITVMGSHLDIAGSRIVGTEAAIMAPRTSKVLFSLSRVQSPYYYGVLHEHRTVIPNQPL